MPTQKTGMDGGSLPPKDQEPADQSEQTDDLGIPENVVIDDDPTGYVPDVPVEELAGRRVRRVRGEHLEEAHTLYAGKNVRMDGSHSGPPGMPQQLDDPTTSPVERVTKETETDAQRLMPAAYKNQPPRSAPPPTSQPYPKERPEKSAATEQEPASKTLRIGRKAAEAAATSFEYLNEMERAAMDKGDMGAAAQARALSDQLQEEYTVKQQSEQKQEHPALTKLLTNLGLKKIARTSIEWGGSDWMFAPTNAELDYWVARNMDEGGLNIPALAVSAGIVGLDDVPIYEVLNIPLKKLHVVTSEDDEENEEGQKCYLTLYKKYCHCGNLIEVDSETCPICGASQDKFDIPMDLRLACAQKFNQMLAEQFGAYESLGQLLDLRSNQMKDRRFDAEELFPLVTPSSEEETIQD